MRRLSLTFALLTLSPVLAQEKVSFQPAPLPYVTLSAPGYTARAEVRPAVTYPESGPNVGPYWGFSPSQTLVVLDKVGQPKWKAGYANDLPPAYVTVTPVQNWLTLYKGAEMRGMVKQELNKIRDLNAGRLSPAQLQARPVPAGNLPHLPFLNSAQAVTGSVKLLNTPQVQGVRYLAIYAQDVSVYPRSAVAYHFQGLSRDGKYVVSVRLPYAPQSLPATSGILQGDVTTYRQSTQQKLDAESGKLAAFDRLVQSIRIR